MAQEILINEKKIDSDILEIDKKISQLTHEREIIIASKKYLLSLSSKNGNGVHKPKPKKEIGITDFIRDFLKNGKMGTHAIIAAWANQLDKDYKEVSAVVSKNLSRLKKAGEINNEVDERGKKFGGKWFLK
jgi:hypothetical protein